MAATNVITVTNGAVAFYDNPGRLPARPGHGRDPVRLLSR